jgi:Na+-translocating ferredoxin:NAD+ oxidoreductase RnfG subunit
MLPRLAATAFLLFAPCAGAEKPAAMTQGMYRVTYRLEVPHVERFATDAETTVCAGSAPRVLSGNNPHSQCPARNLERAGNHLMFDIVCPGRSNDRAQAHAVFTVAPDRLDGRIHMVMGGKNMTYVEVQSWRRIGGCPRLARQD